MSVLLTDEAVRAIGDGVPSREQDARTTVEDFLRFHATEGREALVERVMEAVADEYGSCSNVTAEAVVTALFGPKMVERAAEGVGELRRVLVHDWQPVPERRVHGGVATMECSACGSTYPNGSAVFPCPGPQSTASSGEQKP